MAVVHEHRTRLMGTTAHLIVVGGSPALVDTAAVVVSAPGVCLDGGGLGKGRSSTPTTEPA